MSVKRVPITPAQLTATAATYYTLGANKTGWVVAASVCNTDSSAHTFTFHRVPSGGTASASNMVVKARPIAAGESQVVFELLGKALAAGDTIQALADAPVVLSFDGSVAEAV